MALPIGPPPKNDDVASRGWSAITVSVAWTLLTLGIKPRPQVVREARTHVLYHLPPATLLPDAEDRAAHLTRQFVQRVRGERPTEDSDAEMPLSVRWRTAVERSLNPLSEHVLRKHYGDNRSLAQLETTLGADRIALEGARAGLREVVRRVASADNVPLHGWSPERVDRMLVRLAAYAPEGCPETRDLIAGSHVDHVRRCPRCDRLTRLVRGDVISAEDLLAPSLRARPTAEVDVLALQFRPEARRFRKALAAELDLPLQPLGDDVLLIDASDAEKLHATLCLAAELGEPARDQLRATRLRGPGCFGKHGLLGPLAATADEALCRQPWGKLDGQAELPAPLPAAPSSAGMWRAAALLCIALAGTGAYAWQRPSSSIALPAQVSLTTARGGTWVALDLPEAASLTLVTLQQGKATPVLSPTGPADKAEIAVGDGTYRVHVAGEGALVVSSDGPLADLPGLLRHANEATDPLDRLSELIHLSDPSADVRWTRR